MSKTKISERLRKLATEDDKRSKAARVREVLDDIEAALAAGVSRKAVLEALVTEGLEMTMQTFDTVLKRARRARAGTNKPVGSNQTRRSPHPRVELSQQEQERHSQQEQTTDTSGLSAKQRRERIADEFINPQTTNPLIKRFKDKEQKK